MKFDFFTFYEKYNKFFQYNKELPNNQFLIWFIGFTEGDGSFVITKQNNLAFIITQSTNDIQILQQIQNMLGFGRIRKQGEQVSRYIVESKKELELINYIFNGNLILPSNKNKFKKFLNTYNQKIQKGHIILEHIKFIESTLLPSLSDSWLSGFTDAEGCFTTSFLTNSNAYHTRYILSQKGDINLPVLSHFILLFKTGYIEAHSKKSNYSFIINGRKNCSKIYNYFNTFPLKTKKSLSFLKWKELHKLIKEQKHLNSASRLILIELAKDINLQRRKKK